MAKGRPENLGIGLLILLGVLVWGLARPKKEEEEPPPPEPTPTPEGALEIRGLTVATDRLPRFFSEEPLSPHGEVFDVSDDELAGLWEEG